MTRGAPGSVARAGAPLARAAAWTLLLLHALLGAWGIARNSVTFDETAHVASGVAMVVHGNPWISAVNPPLVKSAFGAATLAAGAQVPQDASLRGRDQFAAAEAVMRANGAAYHGRVAAARAVTLALSLALAVLVWRTARRLYGDGAGVFALALYALTPETLAHGGLATLDLPTALGAFATVLAFVGFARRGTWRAWGILAIAFAALTLTRFTAWMVFALLVALAAGALVAGIAPRRRILAAGVLALLPLGLAALHLGYRGEAEWRPLAEHRFASQRFQALQRAAPALRLPLPDAYLLGLDHQLFESQPGVTSTYLNGRITRDPVREYVAVAVAVKWPLALWAALAIAAVATLTRRPRRALDAGRAFEEWALAALAAITVAGAALAVNLNVGVRYLLPALPPLFVLASRWLAAPVARPRRAVALVVAAALALECASTGPWWLSFFNAAAGGPGAGDRIVNDSNADVGQGLIALREELARLGVSRVHLAYHGTVDPALYGIDYVPYRGGTPGTESDWIAISSYYWVGLSQRMMTREGRTDFMTFDFRPLWPRPPAARPAHCMYLYRLR
jgi:4-amino-4-deoxy-L-arabinose transferase-like glycosyltransferase